MTIELRMTVKGDNPDQLLIDIKTILRTINPNLVLTTQHVRQLILLSIPFTDKDQIEKFKEALRSAGIDQEWSENFLDQD